MPTSKQTEGQKEDGETRSFFGSLLKRKKKSKPSQDEINKQAARKLEVDLAAVGELKRRLEAAGAPSPVVIANAFPEALAKLDPKMPPSLRVSASQKLVDEALACSEAVGAYIAARAKVQTSKDEAGLLAHAQHPIIAKFNPALDKILQHAENRWTGAATSEQAAQHANYLATQVAGTVQKRSELHTLLVDTDKVITKAEDKLRKVSGIGTVNVTAVAQMIGQAREAFAKAQDSNELPGVLKKLEGWEQRLAEATEGKKGSLGLLDSYRKKRQAIVDDIGKASVLRGATEDTPLRQLLNSARIDLDLADEAMAKADDSTLIAKALEILEQHKGLLDRAKKIDAELKQQAKADLDALPKYTAASQELARARIQMAGMGGADEQVRQVDLLLAATRLGPDGRPNGGYAAALKLLEGKAAELLKSARDMSEKFLFAQKLAFPGFDAVKKKAEDKLMDFINKHPPALAGAQQEALAQAMAGDEPLEAMQRLIVQWTQSIESQRELDEKVFAERKRMTEELPKALQELRTPVQVLNALADTEPVDRLRQAHEYAQALAVAQRATKAAEDYLKDAKRLNDAWDQLEPELVQAAQDAMRWVGWPPLANEAKSIDGDAKRIIQAVHTGAIDSGTFENGTGLQGALDAGARLKQRVTALELRAEALGLEDSVDLDAYQESVERAKKDWQRALQPAQEALKALAEALTQAGVGPSASTTTWHEQLAALEKRWSQALAAPTLGQGQSPEQALQELLEQFKTEAGVIQRAAIAAASDSNQLEPLTRQAKASDREKALRSLHAKLAEALRRLQTLGVATEEHWVTLGRQFDPSTAPGLEKKWNELQPLVLRLIKTRVDELGKLSTEGLERAKVLDKSLSSLTSSNQVRFPGFFEDLQGRSSDAQAMLRSGDPALVAAGHEQLEQLSRMLTQARQGGENEGGKALKTFDDVAQLWQQLSNRVGEKVLQSRLPATYNRLRAELNDAVEQAKSMPPDEGWRLLDALRGPIEDANQQAERVAERYSVFKARKEQIENKLVELHKLTSTRFTEKTEAYNKRFAARLADAKGMAKQEGQMDAAFKMLDELDRELAGMLSQPAEAARAELQKLDGEAAAEQRELRDLARAWEAARKYWDDTLLPEVKKALAKRGESSNTEYEDLKGAVSRAAAPVKGYLGVISSLPHEFLAAEDAPDMKAARAAFSSAQGRLRQLQATANRLITGGGTTNVALESDLKKLEDEWINRVKRLRPALEQLASSVRELPARASSDPGDPESYLEPGLVGPLKTAANVVGRAIPEAGSRFSESVFSAPLGVLRNTSASPADRRKAREDVLRIVRRLRDEIVDSSLFRQIYAGSAAGLLDVDVRAELGLLRASLKKIELAALVAV